jgi:hypothetical protein
MAQENPLGLALGALAVGFLAGMLLPSTRIEDERMGEVADRLKDTARQTGQEAIERGRAVAQEAASAAAGMVQEHGRDVVAEQAAAVGQKVVELGKDAVRERSPEAAGEAAREGLEAVREAAGNIASEARERGGEVAGEVTDRVKERAQEEAQQIAERARSRVRGEEPADDSDGALSGLTRTELLERARKAGIAGASAMRKDELLEALASAG